MPQPGAPPKGFLLLSRVPHTRGVKLLYPSGESKFFIHTPNIFRELVDAGIPEEKLTKALDHVWNFYHVMVKTTACEAMP